MSEPYDSEKAWNNFKWYEKIINCIIAIPIICVIIPIACIVCFSDWIAWKKNKSILKPEKFKWHINSIFIR